MRLILIPATALVLSAQTSAPAFDVASIKPSAAQFGSYLRFLAGGRFSGMTWIKQLVQVAYGVEDYQVSGGPAWLTTDRYEIEAKTDDANAGADQMKPMLQALLADRFKLRFHRETKEFSVYDLTVDKNGPKLVPLKPGQSSNCRRDNSEICGIRTTAQLASWLKSVTRQPVLDQTGIQGEFDVLLTFDTYATRGEAPPPDYNKPNLFTAIREQLGLRLEAAKTSLPAIVIDDIQRPTGN